jgi:hypothetical protein
VITTPDRLAGAMAAIERGEPVNWQQIADLQALDMARIGRQFVEESIKQHEASDAAMSELAEGWIKLLEPRNG